MGTRAAVVAAIAVVALAMGGAGVVTALTPYADGDQAADRAFDPASIATADRPHSMSGGRPPTDEEAIAYLRGDTAQFPRLDAVFVIHSTVGRFEERTRTSLEGSDREDEILIVTGVGSVMVPVRDEPNVERSWAAFVIDAKDGVVLRRITSRGPVPDMLRPAPVVQI